MTDCKSSRVDFTGHGRRQVVADFLGGRLTTDAGVLLLREVDRVLGLMDAVDECIPDPRDQRYVVHDQRSMLAQRVYAIALGYEDLNDHETLRVDPALQTASQREPHEETPLASPSTLCRLENRINRKSLARIATVLVDQFISSHETPPEEITLDFDATDDAVHGNQVGRFFHGYYDHYCFLPLYVFCGEQLVCAYLRPSNIDGAKHARAITKLLVNYLRQHWPDVRITIRGDSGFCRWRLMRWCDNHGVSYVFGLAKNAVLKQRIEALAEKAEEGYTKTGKKQRLFGETQYRAKTWDRLKEQQLMLFADRTSCHEFQANQFRLLLSSLAYVLVQQLRQRHLADTDLAKAQVDTIRLRLFKVAARVLVSVRRIVFHLATCYPYQSLFRDVASSVVLQPG